MLNYYDELYKKSKFVNQNIDLYSKKTNFKLFKKRKFEINVNENSNIAIDAYNDYDNSKKNFDNDDTQFEK